MSVLKIFESFRRANAELYTAHPLAHLSEAELTRLAGEAGMTLEELRQQMTTAHVEMTCPLCGQASTHLVDCKGCGGDAWGGEWVLAHGEGFRELLRARFREAVSQSEAVSQEQAAYAARHAYTWGGCMICPACWPQTLPVDAYQSCPLNVLAERTLEPDRLPSGMIRVMLSTRDEAAQRQALQAWVKAGWDRWVDQGNTVPSLAREAVAEWRAWLLHAAWLNDQERQEGG